jgi:hypothetical protein
MAPSKRESLPPASPQDSFSAMAATGQPTGKDATAAFPGWGNLFRSNDPFIQHPNQYGREDLAVLLRTEKFFNSATVDVVKRESIRYEFRNHASHYRHVLISLRPFEDVDLALLRFVRCLIRFGLTLDEAGAVVSGELERFRTGANKKRRRLVLVGMRLVPMPV